MAIEPAISIEDHQHATCRRRRKRALVIFSRAAESRNDLNSVIQQGVNQIEREGEMAYINYDEDQSGRYNSASYNNSRANGRFALLAILLLLVLFFWTDLWQVRSRLASLLMSEPTSVSEPIIRIPPAEAPIVKPVTEARNVTTDNVNMRAQPNNVAKVIQTLPRGTRVAFLGESHQELNGNVWLKVRVETTGGAQVGWVSQRYIE